MSAVDCLKGKCLIGAINQARLKIGTLSPARGLVVCYLAVTHFPMILSPLFFFFSYLLDD
ncbi:hypothetical protein LZ32DRAFT_412348 [Colletotrichum eremochloae]|nr:hypothetical protein LZ32DRAFT_412348 [Colletotrichum eremochloae]